MKKLIYSIIISHYFFSGIFFADAQAVQTDFNQIHTVKNDPVYSFLSAGTATYGLDYDRMRGGLWLSCEDGNAYLVDKNDGTLLQMLNLNGIAIASDDNQNGIDVLPDGNLIFCDNAGDLGSSIDDYIFEVDPEAGALVNYWPTSGIFNTSTDGSDITSIRDIAVGANGNYFISSENDNLIYEISLNNGSPGSWETINTHSVPVINNVTGIDIINNYLVLSDLNSTTVVITDEAFTEIFDFNADHSANTTNSGVCFIEGSFPLNIAVTDFTTDEIACYSFDPCPSILCPSDIVINNDPGNCSAFVSYLSPSGEDLCTDFIEIVFEYTGIIDTWTVPEGITEIVITAIGAEGGDHITSTVAPGFGAKMIGTFSVIPGAELKILVGGKPDLANGGGGGTFVTDISDSPFIVAGGGGGSAETTNSPEKHGNISTTGGTGAGGGGSGGLNGNGGNIGSIGFQSGAGGGLLTDGADGFSAGTGGKAFINGGMGGTYNSTFGGFGGGGVGSGNVVGGGGGGYSGGGSGGNIIGGVGGGGGSYNNGSDQYNIGGFNIGNGRVIITYFPVPETSQFEGLGPDTEFPVGITTESYIVESYGNSTECSFTVEVIDAESPSITCPEDIEVNADESNTYTIIGNEFDPISFDDNCSGFTIENDFNNSESLNGAQLPTGINPITWTITDDSGNSTACNFNVTVNEFVQINKLNEQGIFVFPNPASDILNISFKRNPVHSVQITDMSGMLLKCIPDPQENCKIDLSGFNSGIYFIKFYTDTGIYFFRIIKI